MVYLKYKTRRNEHPQGKARVYFCANEKDQEVWLPQISSKLLELNDCAVYYAEPSVPRDREFLKNLQGMNLFVIPVTRRLLTTENDALDREFSYARENRIPILPILMEKDLLWLYSEKFGDLQFLDPNERDATALSYQEKLTNFLNQTLLNDDMIQKVRAAFDAYVFLSYRKQDRAFAQQLMRLIHQNDFCRDIAIWYDEFLTPGEDFNQSIRKALEDSDLFVMAVTPRIVEPGANSTEDNYIVQKEYPMAKEAGKRILPVEMEKTDKEKLKKKFANLPNSTNGDDPKALATAMKNALQNIALRNPEKSPTHDFFIGLAYLRGVDVEVDYKKAVKLIESAANAEVLPALETMTRLYGAGIGVERSLEKMLQWQQKLIAKRQECYERDNSLQNGLDLLMDLQGIQDLYGNLGYDQAQADAVCRLQKTAQWVRENTPDPEVERYWAAAACIRSQRLWSAGKAEEARALCIQAEQILRQALEKTGIRLTDSGIFGNDQPNVVQTNLLRDYCTILCTWADADLSIYEQNGMIGYLIEAEEYFNQCRQYLTGAVLKDRYPYNWEQRSAIAQRMGDLAKAKGQTVAAKNWYKESVDMDVERAKNAGRDKDFDAFESLAKSLVTLTWADPKDADVLSLMDAVEIWECLAYLVPEFPAYKEYYEELKPRLDQMLSNRKDDKVFRYKKQLHPFQSPVAKALEPLRKLYRKKRALIEQAQNFGAVKARADREKKPEDLYSVADSYHKGIGVRVDLMEACRYAVAAADQWYVPGMRLAVTLLGDSNPTLTKKYQDALERERKAREEEEWERETREKAKAGDGEACLALARMYKSKSEDSWCDDREDMKRQYGQWMAMALTCRYGPAFAEAAKDNLVRDRKKAKEYAKKAIKLGCDDGARLMALLSKTALGKWYWRKMGRSMRDRA